MELGICSLAACAAGRDKTGRDKGRDKTLCSEPCNSEPDSRSSPPGLESESADAAGRRAGDIGDKDIGDKDTLLIPLAEWHAGIQWGQNQWEWGQDTLLAARIRFATGVRQRVTGQCRTGIEFWQGSIGESVGQGVGH